MSGQCSVFINGIIETVVEFFERVVKIAFSAVPDFPLGVISKVRSIKAASTGFTAVLWSSPDGILDKELYFEKESCSTQTDSFLYV